MNSAAVNICVTVASGLCVFLVVDTKSTTYVMQEILRLLDNKIRTPTCTFSAIKGEGDSVVGGKGALDSF